MLIQHEIQLVNRGLKLNKEKMDILLKYSIQNRKTNEKRYNKFIQIYKERFK